MSACNSKMSAISITSISSTSSEKIRMKQFINAVQEYNKTKSEETAGVLSRTLQLIGVSLDINTFDPNSSVVAEFFVSLHELMSNHDSRSPLAWFAVTVLQQACKNQTARKTLIHTYQFLPILSRLLGDHLSRDKKRKLLTLMQELTYGIVISWQISYLPHLLVTLTKWVQSGDEEIVSLSLGVLLNVCHKNLPVIYTLMRTVNTKQFIKTILSLKKTSNEVQICKLLIILKHLDGEVPQSDLLHFVEVTFRTFVEAFETKDLVRLRHIVEFFLEIRVDHNRVEAVKQYEQYYEDVLRILDCVENNISRAKLHDDQTDLDCMMLLFQFLNSLIELKVPKLEILYGRMVNLSLGWIQTETVSTNALALLCSIAVQRDNLEVYQQQQILEPLASGITVLLHIIDSAIPANGSTNSFSDTEQCRKLTALLQLLRILLINETFQNHVANMLKQSSILKIFEALLGSEEPTMIGPGGESRLKESFSNELNEMYVHAVALVSFLSKVKQGWEAILNKIFSHKQVQALLAQTFYSESQFETKLLVFEMVKVKQFPLKEIVKIMSEVQLVLTTQQPIPLSQLNSFYSQEVGMGGLPFMSGAQIEQLDRVIEKISTALANNQVNSIATSEVMELYEYKMAAIGHAERAAQASLEAANQHSTHLQHRLAQMSTEVTRLHQMLFHAQQCDEEARKQLKISEENAAKLNARLLKEQILNKEISQKLSDHEKLIEEQQSINNILEKKISEHSETNLYLTKKYEDQVNKNMALVKASAAIESNMQNLNASLQEKNAILSKNSQQIEKLMQQVCELEELRKQHEETIAIREKELSETHKELENRKRILETITKLTRS